jgi:hypothetical protein
MLSSTVACISTPGSTGENGEATTSPTATAVTPSRTSLLRNVSRHVAGQHIGSRHVREGALSAAVAHQHLTVLFDRQSERTEAN